MLKPWREEQTLISLMSRFSLLFPVAKQVCQRAQLTQQCIKKSFPNHKNKNLISLELKFFSLLKKIHFAQKPCFLPLYLSPTGLRPQLSPCSCCEFFFSLLTLMVLFTAHQVWISVTEPYTTPRNMWK